MKRKFFTLISSMLVLTACGSLSSLSSSSSTHRFQDGIYSSRSDRAAAKQALIDAKSQTIKHFPSAKALEKDQKNTVYYTYSNLDYRDGWMDGYDIGWHDGWSGWGYDPWYRPWSWRRGWYDPYWYGPYYGGPYFGAWWPYYPGWGPRPYPWGPGWGPGPYWPGYRPVIIVDKYRISANRSAAAGRHSVNYGKRTYVTSNGTYVTISGNNSVSRQYGSGIGYTVRNGTTSGSASTGNRSGYTSGASYSGRGSGVTITRRSSTSTGSTPVYRNTSYDNSSRNGYNSSSTSQYRGGSSSYRSSGAGSYGGGSSSSYGGGSGRGRH